jgi:hypothetical protein
MIINKYQRNTKDVMHDIHYRAHGMICRLGSDELPPDGFRKAYNAVCKIASGISDLDVSVDRIEWSRKQDGEVELKLKCTAADQRGGVMELVVKGIGWQRTVRMDESSGKLVEYLKPVRITEQERDAFLKLEELLVRYIRDGSRQLELAFSEEDAAEAGV